MAATRRRNPYVLTEGDKAIFQKTLQEDNYNRFTNYYLRNEDSGTWWRPVTQKQLDTLTIPQSREAAFKWKAGYENLLAIWDYLGRPEFFQPDHDSNGRTWRTLTSEQFETERERLNRCYRTIIEFGGDVVFHHPHGALMLPWQLDMTRSRHPIQVCVGGFGSGKTFSKMMAMLVRAATLPGYRGLALAPYSVQASEVHKQAIQIMENTLFGERFLLRAPSKPYPHLVIGNDYVGENSIECFPIMDGSDKILTLTADEAMIDQSEQLDDIDEVIRNIGSRFRGVVRGRPRRGQITMVANSADNPQLWDWFDEAKEDSEYVWSHSPATFDNTYLTVADLLRFEKQVGKSDAAKRMYIFGERPLGGGEHFPQESLEKCRAEWMTEQMMDAVKAKAKGWEYKEQKRVSIHYWHTPYKKGERYVVVADPGWGNPPERNAAAVSVWRITDFPRTPAHLVAFDWVFGFGSPNPWLARYIEWVKEYHAIGFNGFDSTGIQSGYERLTEIGEYGPTPVSMSGTKKYVFLTLLKKMMADGQLQMPNIIHIFSQLAKYRLPDDKLRQDLVAMLLVLAGMLEQLYYTDFGNEQPRDDYDQYDRYDRPLIEDRYDSRGER